MDESGPIVGGSDRGGPAMSAALARDGGLPVRTRPYPPCPFLADDEIEAARQVLRSGRINYWTGEVGRLFEREFAAVAGCPHAVALANGTLALEAALLACDVGPGDEVIVPCRTFIASASCAAMRGAKPVVVDVDAERQNLTVATVTPALTARTRAIVAVHLAGWPCDVPALRALAQSRGIVVIEDCAQATGATLAGRPVGALGDVAAFSFCQDKIITSGGEGGMLTLADPARFERVWAFKDHGKSYDAVYRRQHPPGFRWLHESFGTNWRLTEVQSALGLAQLRKLPEWVARRRANAAWFDRRFAGHPALRLTRPPPEVGHSYYKYYLFLRPERLAPGWDRDRIVTAVNAEGVPCFVGSCGEIYREKAFTAAGLAPAARFPVAQALSETSLMLLVHPTLSEDDLADAARALEKVLALATR